MALPGAHDESPWAASEPVQPLEPVASYDEPSNVVTPVFGGPRDEAPAPFGGRSDHVADAVVDSPSYRADDDSSTGHADEHPWLRNDLARTPVEEATVDDVAVDETPEESVDEVAVDEVAVDEVLVDEVPEAELPVVETPVAETPVADDEPVSEPSSPTVYEPVDDWGDDPLGAPAASFDQPAPVVELAPEPAPAAVAPLAPVASASNGFGPPTDSPVRLTIRRPLSATPAAAALESDSVPDGGPLNTPIFGQLRSNWLNDEGDASWSDAEVDRGWTAADQAEKADAAIEVHTPTGLPVRRPGGRLVPGGVSNEPTVVARDPDAIRNRLAAHAAGVSRGRAAAAAQPVSTDYAHEETGPA